MFDDSISLTVVECITRYRYGYVEALNASRLPAKSFPKTRLCEIHVHFPSYSDKFLDFISNGIVGILPRHTISNRPILPGCFLAATPDPSGDSRSGHPCRGRFRHQTGIEARPSAAASRSIERGSVGVENDSMQQPWTSTDNFSTRTCFETHVSIIIKSV